MFWVEGGECMITLTFCTPPKYGPEGLAGDGPEEQEARWIFAGRIRSFRASLASGRLDAAVRCLDDLLSDGRLSAAPRRTWAELCVTIMDSVDALAETADDIPGPLHWSEQSWLRQLADWPFGTAREFVKNAVLTAIKSPAERSVHGGTSHVGRATEEVKEIIRREFPHDLTISDIAKRLYLSPNHLSRLFKAETGQTITGFMIQVRLEHAKRLLRTDRSLKTYEVGDRVGYPDPVYFNKLFKRIVGMTPKQYQLRS
jgi:AraC-like DNA-binding protein